jgi:hypothetical protein
MLTVFVKADAIKARYMRAYLFGSSGSLKSCVGLLMGTWGILHTHKIDGENEATKVLFLDGIENSVLLPHSET